MEIKERGGLVGPRALNLPDKEIKTGTPAAVKFGIMSDRKILSRSHGRVMKPETINCRTNVPESFGLHSEQIFGSMKNMSCQCGKSEKDKVPLMKLINNPKYNGVCPVCGTRATISNARKENFGHIELPVPVLNSLFHLFNSYDLHKILGITPKQLKEIAYYKKFVVLNPGPVADKYKYRDIISVDVAVSLRETYGTDFRASSGAACIREILEDIDLVTLQRTLMMEIKEAEEKGRKERIAHLSRRLSAVNAFLESDNVLEDVVHDYIPVKPPDTRPMREIRGVVSYSDADLLYQLVLRRSIRLMEYISLFPEGFLDVYNVQYRFLAASIQQAVDCLFANEKFEGKDMKTYGIPARDRGGRILSSLTKKMGGKNGWLRNNMLGKRVDYSGRSVIVVGPNLRMSQCGLPKDMAMELYKPYVLSRLIADHEEIPNIKVAMQVYNSKSEIVWDALSEVIKGSRVLLNRAPTLHRLGIQAFEPVLIEGKAIRLSPLVCAAFNADFDGDQMAVHLPLSIEAQEESRNLAAAEHNLLKPSDGNPVAVPSQDMVLGIYYLTQERENDKGTGMAFSSINEASLAYENGVITLQAPICVRMSGYMKDGTMVTGKCQTTLGRCLFNEIIPQDLGVVDRTNPETAFLPEINYLVGKKQIKNIITTCINNGKSYDEVSSILDSMKELGYKYSTRSAITVSVADIYVPQEKGAIIAQAEEKVNKTFVNYRRGLTTDEERYREVVSAWKEADEAITRSLLSGMEHTNNIFMMADSGARGSEQQIKQLAGMRGLMADATGRTIELPITSNFREGLDVLEYFISAHGARKGLSDTALRTADAGYLTRRLVYVSQSVVCDGYDCAESDTELPGVYVAALYDGSSVIESLEERIVGRVLCEDIFSDDGDVLIGKNELISPLLAKEICKTRQVVDSKKVKVRTIFTCRHKKGVCAKCYGADLSNWELVKEGTAVGIIAAQSIGEPGTQLTMRTFHTGGVAGDDITQGLPRVENLLENIKPKKKALLAEFDGIIELTSRGSARQIVLRSEDESNRKTYKVNSDLRIIVKNGQAVENGNTLTDGILWTTDILNRKGVSAAREYLMNEIISVYRRQAVEIADKHVEIIVRRMFDFCCITEAEDSGIENGKVMTWDKLETLNEKREAEGYLPIKAEAICVGITKAALYAEDSPLAAASLQETVDILLEAAVRGTTDMLTGLKENVILGKLVPVGTGYVPQK